MFAPPCSAFPGLCIALLLPDALAVFRATAAAVGAITMAGTGSTTIASSTNATSRAAGSAPNYLQLIPLYRHDFADVVPGATSSFKAFNMCCGIFGHGGRDGVNPGSSSSPLATAAAMSLFSANTRLGSGSSRYTALESEPVGAIRAICVQSEDGILAFYEQETFLYIRALSDCTFPGPLAYCYAADALITCTGDMAVEAYSLAGVQGAQQSTLKGTGAVPTRAGVRVSSAVSGGDSAGVADGALAMPNTGGKVHLKLLDMVIKPEWRVNVGEHPAFLFPTAELLGNRGSSGGGINGAGVSSASPSLRCGVLAVCDRWLLHSPFGDESGVSASASGGATSSASTVSAPPDATSRVPPQQRPPRFQRKMECRVVASCIIPATYVNDGEATANPRVQHAPHGLLVATEDRRLLVFLGTSTPVLQWAMALPFRPVAVGVGCFHGTRGLIAALSPTGGVTIVFAGTEPPMLGGQGSGLVGADIGATDGVTSRGTDYAAIESEYRALQLQIRALHDAARFAPADGFELTGESAVAATVGLDEGGPRALTSARAQATRPGSVSLSVLAVAQRLRTPADGVAFSSPAAGRSTTRITKTPTASPNAHLVTIPDEPYFDDDYESEDHASELSAARAAEAVGYAADPSGDSSAQFIPQRVGAAPGLDAGGGEEGHAAATAAGAHLSSAQPFVLPVTISVHCSGAALGDVTLLIDPPPWALLPRARRTIVLPPPSSPPLSTAGSGGGSDAVTYVVTLPFRASPSLLPWSTRVDVSATYTGEGGASRVARTWFHLSLCLAARVIAPSREAAPFKLTLDTNRSAPPLSMLFSDLLSQSTDVVPAAEAERITPTASHVLSFELATAKRDVVTILVSKSGGSAGGRFRVQAAALPALHIVVAALCRRLALAAHHTSGGGGGGTSTGGHASPRSSLDNGPPRWEDALCTDGEAWRPLLSTSIAAAMRVSDPPHDVPPTAHSSTPSSQQKSRALAAAAGATTTTSVAGLHSTTSTSAKAHGQAATSQLAGAAAPVLRADDSTFAIAFYEPLPLADVFAAIEAHWRARAALAVALTALDNKAYEYRLVMKRLLGRFRDSKAPAPLAGLDAVLDHVQAEMVAVAGGVCAAQAATGRCGAALAGTLGLLVTLMKYRFGLPAAAVATLRRVLSARGLIGAPGSGDGSSGAGGGLGELGGNQGWEELASASLSHLLRAMTAASATSDVTSSAGISGGKKTQFGPAAPAVAAPPPAVDVQDLEALTSSALVASSGDASFTATGAAAAAAGLPASASTVTRLITILCDCLAKGLEVPRVA